MKLNEIIDICGSNPMKANGSDLETKDGDYIADFNSYAERLDHATAALVAHSVNNLPRLVQAVYDYIEGPETHTDGALKRLHEAWVAASEVAVDLPEE